MVVHARMVIYTLIYAAYTGNATEGVAVPLNLTTFAHTESKMLSNAPQSVISTLTSAPVTLNLHHYSVLKYGRMPFVCFSKKNLIFI